MNASSKPRQSYLQCGQKRLDLSQPVVMGILNVTPDSFSDGGRFSSLDLALAQAERMVKAGAKIIDVGGESTRPGAEPVSVDEELERVVPVIETLAERIDAVLSVDTSKPEVIRAAARSGAGLINDVRALQLEGAIDAAAKSGLPVCLMHMQGEPDSMQNKPQYDSVLEEVAVFFKSRLEVCKQAGIGLDQIVLDPGIGFGKTLAHNLSLIAGLESFLGFACPLLMGVSRKSMFGQLLNADVDARLAGSLAAGIFAVLKGASILRVHDVAETVDALQVLSALRNSETPATLK